MGLETEYLFANIGVGTVENGSLKVCQQLATSQLRIIPSEGDSHRLRRRGQRRKRLCGNAGVLQPPCVDCYVCSNPKLERIFKLQFCKRFLYLSNCSKTIF